MKKIFTFLTAAAAAISMQAADLQLLFGETLSTLQPVEEGVTYYTPYEYFDWGDGTGMITQSPWLYIQGEAGMEVVVEMTASDPVMFCGVDGQCFQPETHVVKNGTLKNDKPQSLLIDINTDYMGGDNPGEAIHDVTVTISAYDKAKPDNVITTTVVMTNKSPEELSGIGSINANDSYIKVAQGNVLSYSVERPCTLSLYGITGSLAAKYQIADRGAINLSNLPKGIYLYTDGTHKGKLIVR